MDIMDFLHRVTDLIYVILHAIQNILRENKEGFIMRLSRDGYENKCLKMEDVVEKYPTSPYFPTTAEIEAMEADLYKYYDFLVYLTTINPTPSTPDEKASMEMMNLVIDAHTEFTD